MSAYQNCEEINSQKYKDKNIKINSPIFKHKITLIGLKCHKN